MNNEVDSVHVLVKQIVHVPPAQLLTESHNQRTEWALHTSD